MYLSHTKTIVFITGAFINHSCWEEWIVFFEKKGYKTVAPPWPYKNESAEDLRVRHPDSKIASLKLEHLLDYYTEIIQKLSEKPILIGHSYGGLLTQLLLQNELGVAGVCIHSVTPQFVITSKFSFYKAMWKPLGLFTSKKKSYLISFKEWQYGFANKMSFEEQKALYEKLVVPESRMVLRAILTKIKIDFKKRHEPLLFLSGSEDIITPAVVNYSNFKKYKNLQSITCYKEFKGKNHLVLCLPDWENSAEFVSIWLDKVI